MAASPAPSTKFYTYAPGKGAGAIKLAPGQKLGFKPGSGYYAKDGAPAIAPAPPLVSENGQGQGGAPYRPTAPPPAPGRPAPPVSPFAATPASGIDAQAAAQAQGGVDAQSAEVRRQQALATQQAKNDEAAITGFTSAAGQLEAGMAPEISAAYSRATQDQGALGAGIAGQVGADLTAAQAQDDAFAQGQGQSGGHTTHVPDVETTMGMLNGVIPGSQLAAEGAAAATWAAAQPQISIDAGRQQLDARLAAARTEQDGYAQQLITIAQQYPTLKAQALTQLNQYELDKANYRQSVTMNSNTLKNDAATRANNQRALHDQEVAAGLAAQAKGAATNAEYTYKYAALAFKNQQDARKAAAAGKIMDVAASKALGHVVYKDGSQDPSIKVAQSGTAKSSAGKAATAKISARKTAVSEALSLRGKPQLAGKASAGYLGGHGKYVAAAKYRALGQGKPGSVFPDGTTNNQRRASYAGDQYTYPQAQSLIFQKIGGETLMAQYNLSREQVMSWINSALTSAGWSK